MCTFLQLLGGRGALCKDREPGDREREGESEEERQREHRCTCMGSIVCVAGDEVSSTVCVTWTQGMST